MNDPNLNAAAPSSAWPPERRVVYAAITGMLSALITAALKRYGGDWVLPEVVAGVPVLIAAFVAWAIPMTQREVANRVTNQIVRIANEDQSNGTNARVIGAAEASAVRMQDIASGTVQDTSKESI